MAKKIKQKDNSVDGKIENKRHKRVRLNLMKYSALSGQVNHVMNLIQRSSFFIENDDIGFDESGRFYVDCKFKSEDGSFLNLSELVALADGLQSEDSETPDSE